MPDIDHTNDILGSKATSCTELFPVGRIQHNEVKMICLLQRQYLSVIQIS